MRSLIRSRSRRKKSGRHGKVVSRGNKSGSPYGIQINIDEVGSAKGMESQRNYAIVASTISDRFAFAEAVRSIGLNHGVRHELSFAGDRQLRDEVIGAIAQYVDEINYVYANRPSGYEFVSNPKMIHRSLLENLSGTLNLDPGEDVLIFVDSNTDMISNDSVRNIVNPTGSRHIVCLVLPSRYFFELQGHDFLAGSVGQELNRSDSVYTDVLREQGTRIIGRKVRFELRREHEE